MTGRPTGALLLALVAGCGAPGPVPIAYGTAECSHCHMTLTDPPFAAELVTTRRKVYLFDDPGCLAAFVAEGTVPPGEVHSLWVSDFLAPGPLLPAEDATFLRSDSVRTPMNTHVVALRPGPSADSLRAAWGGELLAWPEVVSRAGTGHGP
jgi:copper chaperone NosL